MAGNIGSGEAPLEIAVADQRPVTVLVSRRVRPGAEAAFGEWAHRASAAASRFPGHLGATLQPPDPATGPEHVLIFRFASLRDLRRWEASDERQHWLDEAEPLSEGPPAARLLTGLEGWFEPPAGVASAPPRYKMALLTGAAIFPLVTIFTALAGPLLEPLAPIGRTLLTTAFVVVVMTYALMPWLSRLLRGWLYPASSTPSRQGGPS